MDLILAVSIGVLSAMIFAAAAHALDVLALGARAVGSALRVTKRPFERHSAPVEPERRERAVPIVRDRDRRSIRVGAVEHVLRADHVEERAVPNDLAVGSRSAADLRLTVAAAPRSEYRDAERDIERRPCPTCREVNRAPARFCRACGAHLRM